MSFFRKLSILAVVVIWFGALGGFLFVHFQSPEVQFPQLNAFQFNNIATDFQIQDSTIIDIPAIDAGPENNQSPIFGSIFGVNSLDGVGVKTENSAQTANKSIPSAIPIRLPTGESVPTTNKTGTPNTLDFPSLQIKAPILFATLEDLFVKKPDGTIDTSRQIAETPGDKTHLSTPVQRLLTKGVVHLGFTPFPGEFSNSYIVGHSSNYAVVKSNYNQVFKNLKNAKTGDIFTIYNQEGKGIDFKVFQNIIVDQNASNIAYSEFKDRRVVTLQGSVLVNGEPLKRQLVRGELVQ